MYKKVQKRFALTERGSKDFIKGVFSSVLLNIALILPVLLAYLFLKDYLPGAIGRNGMEAQNVLYYISVGIGFIIIIYIVAYFQYTYSYLNVYRESASRRIALAEKLRKLPLAFYGEKNLSDLTSTIMEDSTELEKTFAHAIPQLFAAAISLLLFSVGLFIYNWKLALALLWVLPFSVAILYFSRKKLDKENTLFYNVKRDVTDAIQEGIETIQDIKSYGNEEAYMSELNTKLNKLEKHLLNTEVWVGGTIHSAQSFLKLGIAGVIITGATLLSTGSISLFMYLIFLIISTKIYKPADDVFNNLGVMFYLDVRIRRMREMMALPAQDGMTNFNPVNYDIVFENVNFAYEENRHQVLKNVSFTARQGEITALVGPSGGGKSTCSKLSARFWDIDAGIITLGGADISKIDPETLLASYSIVFQDVVLFNASIMDNIRIGRHNASDEMVKHAAKQAQCDEFIRRMPDGYHTVIGENGETISGGERQRISIARALLKNAPIVILDEATASLDVENETKIQEAISELVRNKTVLIIAHRMRTIANADKIVVLDAGKVAECGSPEELKARNGVFSKMVSLQMQN